MMFSFQCSLSHQLRELENFIKLFYVPSRHAKKMMTMKEVSEIYAMRKFDSSIIKIKLARGHINSIKTYDGGSWTTLTLTWMCSFKVNFNKFPWFRRAVSVLGWEFRNLNLDIQLAAPRQVSRSMDGSRVIAELDRSWVGLWWAMISRRTVKRRAKFQPKLNTKSHYSNGSCVRRLPWNRKFV